MNRTLFLIAIAMAILLSSATQAGLKDKFKSLFDKDKSNSEQVSDALSSEDQVAGLKEVLGQGVGFAIETLGQTDGFWTNDLVQIPVPEQLKSVAKMARKLGAERYVDDFQETLNRAAEQAVPVASEIFADAISAMTIDDAMAIITGPDDAATQYFRVHTEGPLKQQFEPIVATATDEAGVTQAYKGLQSKAGGVLSMFGSEEDMDLDNYVTEKALDGLFFYIAAEEEKIRTNPVARTTDLMKAMFGSG